MGDVTYFNGVTRLPIPVDRVLDQAREAGMTEVVVLGYDAQGQEYFAASEADGGSVLWLLERCRMRLLAPEGE